MPASQRGISPALAGTARKYSFDLHTVPQLCIILVMEFKDGSQLHIDIDRKHLRLLRLA